MNRGTGGGLRGDLAKAQKQLDGLPNGSVIIDRNGDAWQYGSVGRDVAWWYRAYDGDGISSFQLAQRAEIVKVVHRPVSSPVVGDPE